MESILQRPEDAGAAQQGVLVLANLRAACEAHNRTFNVIYDLSGSTGTKEKSPKEFIMADWEWIIQQGYTKSPSY
jgi:hypothetical protein